MAHKLPIADIRFIQEFHAYCLTRGDDAYDFQDTTNCATCQFLRGTGRAVEPDVDYGGWKASVDAERNAFPGGEDFNKILGGEDYWVECSDGWTFSALATRLEALLADAPAVVSA
ncbi:hypothetical protein [Tsuneonella sp. HG222]